MDRRAKLLCMKEVLEHLGACYERWQDVDRHDERYVADAMRRGLDDFRRLCESLTCDARNNPSRETAYT